MLGDLEFKPAISLKCIQMKPIGQSVIELKKTKDRIIVEKPSSGIFNLFIGERTFHHFGIMTATNSTNGDVAEIYFKDKPFFGKPDTSCEGTIKNRRGEVKYLIQGDWKTHIDFYDATTNKKIPGFKKLPDLPRWQENYGMPKMSRNMNHLSKQTLESICPTDSRFRGDQRAMDYGDFDLASDEKTRLEEAQRARRKIRKENNITHKPVWFEKKFDKKVGREIWMYKGGYFEARKTGNWGDLPKLY